jgi:hypothetical protein
MITPYPRMLNFRPFCSSWIGHTELHTLANQLILLLVKSLTLLVLVLVLVRFLHEFEENETDNECDHPKHPAFYRLARV